MLQNVDGAQCAAALKERSMAPRKPITIASASSQSTLTPAPAAPAPATAPAATPPSPPPSPPPASDPNAALSAYVQQTVASLDTIEAGLGSDQPLGPKDRRRAAKLRKGGDKVVAWIGDLATQHDLESPALQVATMLALVGKAAALSPLTNRLAALTKLVGDLVFVAQSQAWGMAMQYYALLHRRAANDGQLAASLAPITQFLSYRHPSTQAPVGAPTKRQINAAKKAQKALATVAGGKLADTNLLTPRKQPALPAQGGAATAPAASPAPSPAPATAGNGAPPNGAPPATNGGGTPTAHS